MPGAQSFEKTNKSIMPTRGRPPKPGTTEEKAAARRERVRNNVRALRERRKKEAQEQADSNGTLVIRRESTDETDETASFSGSRKESIAAQTGLPEKKSKTLSLVNSRNNVSLPLPFSIDSKSPYAIALMATVRVQFLPDSIYLPPTVDGVTLKPWESDQPLWTPCAFWVTSAFTKASGQESSLLKTSLLAIGTLLKSLEFNDPELRAASSELYRRCLQGIRKALEPLLSGSNERPKDTVALYLACHAAAMYELCQSSDLKTAMYHLRGVSHLICHLGDDRDVDAQSVAWLLLQDYRMAEMGLCMKFRYCSYSSLKKRQFQNQSAEQKRSLSRSMHSDSSNVLVAITDIADGICEVMVDFDAIKHDPVDSSFLEQCRRMVEKLDSLETRFKPLFDFLAYKFGPAFISIDTESDGPGSASLKFKTFDIGAAFCYGIMTELHCLETQIEIAQAVLNTNMEDDTFSRSKIASTRQEHRGLCLRLTQCLHYFLQTDKGITGGALSIFPLDAASVMLENEYNRLQIDLGSADKAHTSVEEYSAIKRDIVVISEAQKFCVKMQDRAKAFGLPGLYDR